MVSAFTSSKIYVTHELMKIHSATVCMQHSICLNDSDKKELDFIRISTEKIINRLIHE